ncbi:MAG: pilus assembly protein [Desulfobacterales bacterium PC51MH44]|nr:MAG: pilus assembly protein [Desulfobacterales bacterium PC51MH44]
MVLKKLKAQKGAAAVELAIILPLLVMLLFGMIEFGIILYDKAMITNASREGARKGILFVPGGISDSDIRKVVKNYCSGHMITFGEDSIDDSDISITRAGGNLTVTVTYQYDFLVLPNFVTGIVGNINLSAVTTMMME